MGELVKAKETRLADIAEMQHDLNSVREALGQRIESARASTKAEVEERIGVDEQMERELNDVRAELKLFLGWKVEASQEFDKSLDVLRQLLNQEVLTRTKEAKQ